MSKHLERWTLTLDASWNGDFNNVTRTFSLITPRLTWRERLSIIWMVIRRGQLTLKGMYA